MAESSWPFDNADTTETQYSQLFRRLQHTGVFGDPSTSDLKVQYNASGMQIKVSPGYALVRGHMYYNSTDRILTLPVGGAAPRVDLVVLTLDPAANTIVAATITGDPANWGADPGYDSSANYIPTQTDAGVYQLMIGYATVAAGQSALAAGDVKTLATYMGSQVGLWTTGTRPKTPRVGASLGYNMTLSTFEFWNGTAWAPLAPSSFTASQISDPQNLSVGNSALVNGKKITISQTEPASPAVGDLWVSW